VTRPKIKRYGQSEADMTRHDSLVFTPGRIGPLELKNRLIRSATFEHAAGLQGEVTDALVGIHHSLAKGGAGLIVTGITWIDSRMPARPQIARADNDAFIPGLTRLAAAVHTTDPACRIVLQFYHPGRQVVLPGAPFSVPATPPGMADYAHRHPEVLQQAHPAVAWPEPLAPSAVHDTLFDRTPRALELEEIDRIIDDFAEGIRRAREAGFDGVQLHAAHGWLLSSFLSPHTNRRDDLFGGSTRNRVRIVTDIYDRARKRVGKDFPILIKFNATDFLPGGMQLEEAVEIGRILTETGFAALEVSGGMWEAVTRDRAELGWMPVLLPESRTGIDAPEKEAYFLPAAAAIKNATGATVISVGGYRSFAKVETALRSGAADFVALSRPLVRRPDLPNRWLTGAADGSSCTSCNGCLPVGNEILRCRKG
jgi:2,4-dienoyl-CoA reductase-like NADH-dependent reductase (Old Yellow Enzyme family)